MDLIGFIALTLFEDQHLSLARIYMDRGQCGFLLISIHILQWTWFCNAKIKRDNTDKYRKRHRQIQKNNQIGLFNSFGNVYTGCFGFLNLKILLFCSNTMLKSDIQPTPSVLLAQKVHKVCTLSCLRRRNQKGCYAMTEQHLSLQSFQSLILTLHCPSDHKLGQSPKVWR